MSFVSRRAPLQRRDPGFSVRLRITSGRGDGSEPSLDAIAEAVVRARHANNPESPAARGDWARALSRTATIEARGSTARLSTSVPLHRIVEGTIIDAVLTNRLDGAAASPVNCLVTNPVYSPDGQHVLMPAGARILGETRQVGGFNDTRLAVGFHRIVMPDGQSVALDQFKGLNQRGDSGLKDRVNQHYWSTFGAAAAVGLVGGLSQFSGAPRWAAATETGR